VQLTYRHYDNTIVERRVNPYGLVAKASIWYLVCATAESGGELRVYRVGRIKAAELTDEHFERPETFDLSAFWARWTAAFEKSRYPYLVTLSVKPEAIDELADALGSSVYGLAAQAGPPDTQGRIKFTFYFESLSQARHHLFSVGTMAEVLEPQELRASLADFAASLARLYGK